MPRPTVMTGWWGTLLEKRASGRVDLLAQLLGVSTRTLNRWQNGVIKRPDVQKRKLIRQIAGKELLNSPECPRYLRLKAPQHA